MQAYMTWTWTPPPCPPGSSKLPLIIPCFALQFLPCTATSTLLHCIELLHFTLCIALNFILPVPPCMWPLSRPNPISQWTGHRGPIPRNTMQPVNTKHCLVMQCTCVSHLTVIVEHISSVTFDLPKHNACEPTFLLNTACTIFVNICALETWKAQEKQKLSNHAPVLHIVLTAEKPGEQNQITAQDVCDTQYICKPDLFQNYQSTMGPTFGDIVRIYSVLALMHACA